MENRGSTAGFNGAVLRGILPGVGAPEVFLRKNFPRSKIGSIPLEIACLCAVILCRNNLVTFIG